eukprot:4764889-Pyramimonas_sp.AAC.2
MDDARKKRRPNKRATPKLRRAPVCNRGPQNLDESGRYPGTLTLRFRPLRISAKEIAPRLHRARSPSLIRRGRNRLRK